MKKTHPPKAARGFSLIELACSMGVGSLVLLMATALLGSSGDGYQRINSNVATSREARAMIGQISSDLATAKFHPSQLIETPSAAWPSHRLGALFLQPLDAQSDAGRIGDLCAVHYYLADLKSGDKTIRCLMRGLRESSDTFAALKNQSTASLFEKRPATDEPIGFGVASFELQPMTRDSDGKWMAWTSQSTTAPQAISMRLVIAAPKLAERLKSPDDWSGIGSNSNFLGKPAQASSHQDLEVHETLVRFGRHDSP